VNYAIEKGKEQESYQPEHQRTGKVRQTAEAGGGDCSGRGRHEQAQAAHQDAEQEEPQATRTKGTKEIVEGFSYRYIGPVSVLLFTSVGAWLSLGVHVSAQPPCIDLHLLWWTLSVTSREHGEETVISLESD